MKKLLAMVLALVMTLSLAVSANAAFKDVKDIDETYAESAAVLNGLGVFKGYEEKDGTFSFQPKNAITRAEVAAIVYRIYTTDVKDTYVKNYETYNKFSDMAGAGWAKGYIGYCANAALVKGYPNGTFVPSGKVTGYEVLAMILRAVGYDQKNEFTGADWALHVAEIAEQNKILKNVKGVDLNAPATREVVAELLFQAIQVPMVTYTAAFGYQNVSLNEKADNKIFAKNKTLGDAFNLASYKGYITYNAKKEAMVLTEKGEKTADDVIVTVADHNHRDLSGQFCHLAAETWVTGIDDSQRLHFPHHPQIIFLDLQIPLGVADKHAVPVFFCHGFDALQQHDIIRVCQCRAEHNQKFSALCRPADPLFWQVII